MIQNDHFIIKTKVYFNKGSMQMLRCMKGHCALVVSDGIMQELGYLKMAQGYLKDAGINSAVFTGVKPDPDVNVVAIDYDPGATRVNQENRLKLMLANAKDKLHESV